MEYATGNKIDIKKANRNRIYKLIYEEGKISKPEIALRLGISIPTAMQNVKSLMEEGLVKEGESLESTGGRKAVAITCMDDARYAIGINITMSDISMVLIDLKAKIIAEHRLEKEFQNINEYFKAVGNAVNEMIVTSGIEKNKILGAGISCPGVFSEDAQILIYSHALKISGLQCLSFQNYISFPCVFCNDANAAGIAEMWNRKDIKNALYLALNNTVGGSMILDHKLYYGENQRCGEFGHMTLVEDGIPCYCGKKGCVDSYCSARVLSTHTDGDLNQFFYELKNDKKEIGVVWEKYLDKLSVVVSNLFLALDSKIILGGTVGAHMDEYMNEIKTRVEEQSLFVGSEHNIIACNYKNEASAVGAGLLYIKPFINNI